MVGKASSRAISILVSEAMKIVGMVAIIVGKDVGIVERASQNPHQVAETTDKVAKMVAATPSQPWIKPLVGSTKP